MGAWVGWKQMTTAQRLEATKLRPAWPLHQFRDFDFYIRKDGHVSQAKGGGAHSLSDQAAHRMMGWKIIDRPTPKQIAAAVQGYVRALRLLGHDDAHVAQIADALHISEHEVEGAFRDFRISGAKIDPKVRVNHVRHHGTFSQVVRLKQRRGDKRSSR